MFIPIASFNRREDAWGADASMFNPERFMEGRIPQGATQLPSAAFPTFIAGPRVCIGFRFALLEFVIPSLYLSIGMNTEFRAAQDEDNHISSDTILRVSPCCLARRGAGPSHVCPI